MIPEFVGRVPVVATLHDLDLCGDENYGPARMLWSKQLPTLFRNENVQA
jgi:ATP-dependent protease Clp ATPase subunit